MLISKYNILEDFRVEIPASFRLKMDIQQQRGSKEILCTATKPGNRVICFPLDASDYSKSTVSWAFQKLLASNDSVILLHVRISEIHQYTREYSAKLKAESHELLHAFGNRVLTS